MTHHEDSILVGMTPLKKGIRRLDRLRDTLKLSSVPGDDLAGFAKEILLAISQALEKSTGEGGGRVWDVAKTETRLTFSSASFSMWVDFGEERQLESVGYSSTGISEGRSTNLWAWSADWTDAEHARHLGVIREHLLWAENHQ